MGERGNRGGKKTQDLWEEVETAGTPGWVWTGELERLAEWAVPGPATQLGSGRGQLAPSSPNPEAGHLHLGQGLILPANSGPQESATLSFLGGQVTNSYHFPSR